MITKNEEAFLEGCLNSVKSIIDEIIIADTGSTDNTKEVAKRFNAKIIDFKWGYDFSDARNESLKHAIGEWILVLDADEVIAENDLAKIIKLIENKDAAGYKLIQRNYYGKGDFKDDYKESQGFSGYTPSPLVRLFQNNKGYFFTNVIHEVVEDSIREKNGKIKLTDIPIHHFSALKSEKVQEQREKMYFEMKKKQIELTPNNPKPYYEIGRIYKYKKDTIKAIQHFEQAIRLLKNYKERLAIHDFIYFDLGEAYIDAKEFEKAKPLIEEAIRLNPKHRLAYFYLGLIYDEKNDFEKARSNYKKAIEINPNAENAYNNLAILHIKRKEYKKAYDVLKKAININHPKKIQMQELLKEIERKLGYSYSVSID